MLAHLAAIAEGGHHVVNELWFPPIWFGVIALVALVAFLLISLMFRNLGSSHPEHSEVSPHVPFVHPGGHGH